MPDFVLHLQCFLHLCKSLLKYVGLSWVLVVYCITFFFFRQFIKELNCYFCYMPIHPSIQWRLSSDWKISINCVFSWSKDVKSQIFFRFSGCALDFQLLLRSRVRSGLGWGQGFLPYLATFSSYVAISGTGLVFRQQYPVLTTIIITVYTRLNHHPT